MQPVDCTRNWTDGAPLNFTRTYGLGLVGSYWTGYLVYWVGPILAGAVAAGIYSRLLMPKTSDSTAVE